MTTGSKVRGAEADPKLLPPKKIGLPSVGGKRDGQTAIPGSSLVAKKQKVVGQPFALGRAGEGEGRSSPTVQPEQYDEIAKEGMYTLVVEKLWILSFVEKHVPYCIQEATFILCIGQNTSIDIHAQVRCSHEQLLKVPLVILGGNLVLNNKFFSTRFWMMFC